MSKPVRYPTNANLEMSKRLSNLIRLSELVNSELDLITRYSEIAQLQREDLEEQLEDIREDMKTPEKETARQQSNCPKNRLNNHLTLTRKESEDA